MPIIVSGHCHLSNGTKPTLFYESSGIIVKDEKKIEYKCRIFNDQISLEFTESLGTDDDIFRFSRHIVDSMFLTLVPYHRVGIDYTLESARKQDGSIVNSIPDKAPAVDPIDCDQITLQKMLGKEPRLRYAIRDYNHGLLNREDCPFYFYRCIETLAKLVTDDDEINNDVWKQLHDTLGTERSDLQTLEEINRPHRHGTHSEFNKAQHLKMMEEVTNFLTKSINHIRQSCE